MNIPEMLQGLEVDARIELFEISTVPIGGTDIFRFHAGTNKVEQSIYWQGNEYVPFPCESEGFDKSTKGTLPRPRFRIANVTGIISAVLKDFDDLIGAEVRRKVTFAQYLDGQPTADPTQALPDDLFYVEQKISETNIMVELELASALDLLGQQLPARDITVNSCTWEYRGPDCGYTGTRYFNVIDIQVYNAGDDVCSKTTRGCKCRFDATKRLPFGSFPAARAFKY